MILAYVSTMCDDVLLLISFILHVLYVMCMRMTFQMRMDWRMKEISNMDSSIEFRNIGFRVVRFALEMGILHHEIEC